MTKDDSKQFSMVFVKLLVTETEHKNQSFRIEGIGLGKKCSNILCRVPFGSSPKMWCDAGHLLVAPSAISEQQKTHVMQNWQQAES